MRRPLALLTLVASLAAACSGGGDDGSRLARMSGLPLRPSTTITAPVAATTTTTTTTPAPPEPSVALTAFGGCQDLLGHVRQQAMNVVTAWGLGGGGPRLAEADLAAGGTSSVGAPASGDGGGTTAAPAPSAAYSGTNVQEADVDEPDLVKTDGDRMLVVAQGRLQRIDLGAEGPVRLASAALGGGHPTELLLAGDRALVFGHVQPDPEPQPPPPGGARSAAYGGGGTAIWAVDLAGGGIDVIAALRVDGRYLSARMVDGIARVVLSSGLRTPPFVHPEDHSRQAEQRALARNRELVATSTLDDWMPRYELRAPRDGRSAVAATGRLSPCDRMLQPPEPSGLGTLTVLTIDPADPRPDASASVLAAGETVYASTDRLYVATGRWQASFGAAGEADVIGRGGVTTAVHAFDITDPRRATYLASGAVPGWALNQWALSEHDGHLRVATTVDGPQPGAQGPAAQPPASHSMVTVLAERGGALVPVGQVGDLGRGERIYAVRFMGPLGYVVTFRETDPLYVLDLSDPARPALRGELHMLGYSAYLHPVGEGLLLGVGQDATEDGRRLGVQASLFDVSDPAAPKRLHQWTAGGPSHSPLEQDHRAFLYWQPSGTAAFPVERWPEAPEGDGTAAQPEQGAVVLRVGTEPPALAEVARLSHQGRPARDGWAAVQRSVVVGDVLYTVSAAGVLASDLTTFEDRLWLAF